MLLATGAAQAADVYAASPAPAMAAPAKEDWYLTLGVSARGEPQYPGSDKYDAVFAPVFSLKKASGLNAFDSIDDNPSIALFDTGTFRIGATGKLDLGRDEDDSDKLRGLGNVDPSLEIGAFTEFYPWEWLRLRAELRYGFGGFEGLGGDIGADVIVPIADSWRFAVGPRLSFASSSYMNTYFGVTPFQSISATFLGNPLPVYSASGGIDQVGVTAQLDKMFANGVIVGVYGTYGRLLNSAADSPLTEDDNVFMAGISVAYAFNIGKSWW